MQIYSHTHIQKYYILCLNVSKNVPFTEKSQLQSALQRVDKYILATQTISHLEDEHPRLKKQRKINWLFRSLSEESEVRGTLEIPIHILHNLNIQ